MTNGYRNRNRKSDDRNINNPVPDIIEKIKSLSSLKDLKAKDYADEGGYADKIAEYFSGRGNDSKVLNTNQLRKFFGAIRDIESKEEGLWSAIEPKFYLLKPKLAVAVGRNLIPKDFYKLMLATMRKVDKGNDEEKLANFRKFVNFLEAIVAYRKYYD